MKTLTEVDAFAPTITVPEGGDGRNAASVETGMQQLANRTRNLARRAQQKERFYACNFGPTVAPENFRFALGAGEINPSGGFAVSGSYYLTFPAVGYYLVTANAYAKFATVVAGWTAMGFNIRIGPATESGGSFTYYSCETLRDGAIPNTAERISKTFVVNITDLANQKLSIVDWVTAAPGSVAQGILNILGLSVG